MMKYDKPNMEIQIFELIDIICTSQDSDLNVDEDYKGEGF